MKAERGTMSGCSTGSDTASNSLALPELRSYSVAVALAVVYLELVRNATTAAEPGRTETLAEGVHDA